MQYTANGLESKARAIEVIANNLANASSAGFKRSVVFSESMQNSSSPKDVSRPEEQIDFSQGRLRETGNKLDLAIDGSGFFTVQTEQGLCYTRQGSFVLNTEGFLATGDGDLVLGLAGPIRIAQDSSIADDGAISSGGEVIDHLAITHVTDSSKLVRAGEGKFLVSDESAISEAENGVQVKSGFLEDSNVDPLQEMASMIEVYRQFEANQKAMRAQDETLDKAVNQVGRV
jgi:flagellar basal-body rod protein FlgF